MIKYCDRCKWDELTQSKAVPDGTQDVQECPVCEEDLCETEDYDSIP